MTEVFGVVRHHGHLVAQAGCGDENVCDAHWLAVVEQVGIEAGGDARTLGIEGQDLEGGDEARDF